MHAKLVALAAKPGCKAVDAWNVRAPQCRLSEVFTEVSAVTKAEAGYDFVSAGSYFIVTAVEGELINIIED